MEKIIVTGGTGFFGINWYLKTKSKYSNYLIENKARFKNKIKNSIKINLDHYLSIEKAILKIRPNILIHAAANTNLDLSKKNALEEQKKQINISKNILKACRKYNIFLIFISSDQLYSGKKKIYNEQDNTQPLNWYAKSKLQSEKYIRKYKKSTIIRTNFFGWAPNKRKSFSDFIIFNVNRKKIRLYSNIYYTPIFINNLITSIEKIIDKSIYGTFNISGNEIINKYKFGIKLANLFGLKKKNIYKSKYIQEKNKIIRPNNMSLSNKKILNNGIIITTLDDQIKEMFEEFKKNYHKKIRYHFI